MADDKTILCIEDDSTLRMLISEELAFAGYRLLEAVNAGSEDPVPFIMLTALADRQNQIRGRELGVVDYLVKPVDFDLLLASVASHIRRRRRSDVYADDAF